MRSVLIPCSDLLMKRLSIHCFQFIQERKENGCWKTTFNFRFNDVLAKETFKGKGNYMMRGLYTHELIFLFCQDYVTSLRCVVYLS